jgi:hypothetical protein
MLAAMMRPASWVVPALSAMGGGVVGTLLTLWLALPNKPAKKKSVEQAEVTAVAEARASDVEERVAALERALGRMNRRSPVAAPSPTLAGSGSAGAADGTSGNAAPIVDNPVFEAAVRDVLERVDQEHESEREAARSEWRQRWADDWVSELGDKLHLNDTQKAKAKQIALDFWQHLRELRDSDAGPPASRDEWRTRMGALREQAEATLAQSLDPSQMDSYRKLDDDKRLGFRFGRGGGGRQDAPRGSD